MARLPRIIIPNIPHHVTQRGNRRQQTFFDDFDYLFYLRNLRDLSVSTGVEVVAYCLMPNHIHLVLTPPSREALISLVSELHQHYTRYINFKMNWRGHFWQGRFFSVPLSEQHFERCVYYVEQNPIRANIITSGEKYRWSSNFANIRGFSQVDLDFSEIRKMTKTGRPLGSERFLRMVTDLSGFDPRPKPKGRRPKEIGNGRVDPI